jgi:hypothetical protein
MMEITIFNLIYAIVAAFLFITIFTSPYGVFKAFKRDDTDGKKKSGLVIYTDYKTGVQYVGNQLGGLTVRVDENGKPMTEYRKNE